MKRFFLDPTISSWVFSASKILVLIFLTALIVKNFTVGEIALWYLFASIQGLAHLFDVGFSTTIIRFTAYMLAKDENEGKRNFNSLYGSMNTIFMVLTFLVVGFLILAGIFSVDEIVAKNAMINGGKAYWAILFIMPINFFLKKNDAFIKGFNKVALFNNWNAGMYLLTGISTITAILLKLPFHWVVLVNQLTILANSLKNMYLLKRFTRFDFSFFKFSFDAVLIRQYWTPTWKSALISFSSNGASNLINILIPKFFPVEVVASYLFTMRLINVISEFSWAPFYSLIPNFIQNFKKGNVGQTARLAYKRLELSLVLFVLGIILLGVLGNPVLLLVDSKTTVLPAQFLSILLVMLTLERFTAMHSQVIMFSNNIEHYKYYLFFAFTYIILFFLLKSPLGLYAIPWAFILGVFFPAWVILKRSLRIMETNAVSYLTQRSLKVILLLIFGVTMLCLWL